MDENEQLRPEDVQTPVPDVPPMEPLEAAKQDRVEDVLAEAGVEIEDVSSPQQTAQADRARELGEAGVEMMPFRIGEDGVKEAKFSDLFPEEKEPIEVKDFSVLLDVVRKIESHLSKLVQFQTEQR